MGCGQSVAQPAATGTYQSVGPSSVRSNDPTQSPHSATTQPNHVTLTTAVPSSTTMTSTTNPLALAEHQLSDISSDEDDGSGTWGGSGGARHSLDHGIGAHRTKSSAALLDRDEMSLEADLIFEYDGVVINTRSCNFDARSKMHLSQMQHNSSKSHHDKLGMSGSAGGAGRSGSSAGGGDKFSFGDFKVNIIDEMDSIETKSSPASPTDMEIKEDLQRRRSFKSAVAPESGAAAAGAGAAGAAATAETVVAPTIFVPPPKPYKEVRRFDVTNLLGHASRVKCIAIAPNEREYVSCSNEDASVTLFNFSTGKESAIFTGHQDTVINATFSSDGKYLATTSRDHTMILWDVVTAKQMLTFDHAKVVICCCFSKDSKYVATGCQDKVCRLWETRKGREHLVFAQHEGIIISMSYSPDNAFIVSASADKTLRVWSTANAKCRFTLVGHVGIVLVCHYTSDGKSIISNDEKLLKIWNAADGTCTKTLQVEDLCTRGVPVPSTVKKMTWTLSCPAPGEFSHYLFVACNNRFVYLLDAETGEEVSHVFCKAPVYCLAMGHRHRVSFGDSFGNVYLVTLR